MASLPTVRIHNPKPGGTPVLIINERDFDPQKHRLYVEETTDAPQSEIQIEEIPQRRLRRIRGGGA